MSNCFYEEDIPSLTLEDIVALYLYKDNHPLYHSIRDYGYDCSLGLLLHYRTDYLTDIEPEYRTRLVCWIAVNTYGHNIKDVPPRYITYELCLIAAANTGDVISDIARLNPSFITKELCEAAVKEDLYMGEDVYPYPITVIKFIAENSLFKKFLTYDLCLLSVEQNGYNISDTPVEFVTKELCKTAIKSNGDSIQVITILFPKFVTIELLELVSTTCHGTGIISILQNKKQYLTLGLFMSAVKIKGFTESLLIPEKFKHLV